MAKNSKTLVLIDGHAHLFQAYHAITYLSDPEGRPVNAVYGVLNILFRILEKFPCSHLAVVFDSPGPTFRNEIYPEYKANRGEMDEELKEQIPRLHDLLKIMNIPVLSQSGYECDDIIGTLATRAEKNGYQTIMISDDKDFGQLISKNITQYKNRKDTLLDTKKHEVEVGIRPDQMIDYLALVGDSSDNVPGIPGVGPKTAVTLLKNYQNADNLYDHLDDLKGKRRENIENNRDIFERARQLVTIKRDTPIDIELDELKRIPWDETQVAQAFEQYGFKRFLERLNLNAANSDNQQAQNNKNRHYQGVFHLHELKKLIKKIEKFDLIAIDTETTGLNPYQDTLVGISLSWEPGKAAYVAFDYPEDSPEKPTLTLPEAVNTLKPFLQKKSITWVGHNLKFDASFLHQAGISLNHQWQDTMLLAFTLDSGNRRLKLDNLAWDLLGEKMIPIVELIGKGKNALTMNQVPLEKVTHYAAEDADMTLSLFNHLCEGIEKNDRRFEKYCQQEIPLSQLLMKMENHGICLDTKYLKTLSNKTEKEIKTLEKKIHQLADKEFNINSPKQLGEILFEHLNLPVIKKTKTGYSTDSKVLAKLAPYHEVPSLVEEYRQLTKLKSTYMDALPELVDTHGVLHTTFSQTAAITGRLASNNPNLQNIPIRNPKGRAIRGAFCPRQNDRFLSVDYSQIELRLMAHYSEDPELCYAFEQGLDIHRYVAAEVYNIDQDDVNEEQRSAAKAVNFGILFGQGAFGLSEQLGISQKEAKEFIEQYFEKFSKVRQFIDKTIEQAKTHGYVETYLGHRRPIQELKSSNQMVRKHGERIAVNTLMQGSEADIIKIAMLRINDWLENNQNETAIVLQIHDELVFDINHQHINQLEKILPDLMTKNFNLNVPLEINYQSGKNWLEAK